MGVEIASFCQDCRQHEDLPFVGQSFSVIYRYRFGGTKSITDAVPYRVNVEGNTPNIGPPGLFSLARPGRLRQSHWVDPQL